MEKKLQTKRISSFKLEKVGEAGEEIDPGCFVRVKLPTGLIRPYSIIGDNTHKFELGIALEDDSRGGSRYFHKSVEKGDKVLIGKITEGVPIKGGASNHIFIAGGSGSLLFYPCSPSLTKSTSITNYTMPSDLPKIFLSKS